MSTWRDVGESARSVVTIVVFVFIITIVAALAYYVIGAFNTSGITVPSNANLIQSVVNLFPSIGSIIGITILILFVALMIQPLLKAVREPQQL